MEWKDVGTVISEAAPTVGSILGGIFAGGPGSTLGGAAGNAISSLLKSLGLAADAKPDQVLEAIKADPQAVIKLRMAEMDYQLALNKQKLEEQEMFLKDVQSARQREIETTKATGKRDINQYVLAWVIVNGFFGLMALLIFRELPKDQNGVIFMLFGALAAGFGSIMNYYFGSSKGSAEKTQLLTKGQ